MLQRDRWDEMRRLIRLRRGHLSDRPRTLRRPYGEGKVRLEQHALADFWGFERRCAGRPFQACP